MKKNDWFYLLLAVLVVVFVTIIVNIARDAAEIVAVVVKDEPDTPYLYLQLCERDSRSTVSLDWLMAEYDPVGILTIKYIGFTGAKIDMDTKQLNMVKVVVPSNDGQVYLVEIVDCLYP